MQTILIDLSSGFSDLESRPLRVPLLSHSVKTALGPIVCPLEAMEADPKCQVSGRPSRATICFIPMIFGLFSLALLHAAI